MINASIATRSSREVARLPKPLMHFIRIAVVLGVVSATALSVSGLPLSASLVAPSVMAAADREVVRDAYNGLAGVLSQAGVTAVPVARLVSHSVPSAASFGGGGFGPLGVASMVLPGFNSAFVGSATNAYSFTTPKSGGVYFSFSNAAPQSNVVIGAVQVPDAGVTALLLGVSLLMLLLSHRLFRRSRLAVILVRH